MVALADTLEPRSDLNHSTHRADCAGTGTCFLFSPSALVTSLGELKRAFPKAEVFYALKANPSLVVLTTLLATDCGFEAASLGEIELLRRLGIPAGRMIYGTAVKPRSHVERAAALGVDRFAADSREELTMLADAAPGSRVFIRAKVDDSGSVFQMSGKFGVAADQTAPLLRFAAQLGLMPWGVSINVGSQATTATAWARGVAAVAPTFTELLAEDIRLEVLNLGGGFPVQYAEQTVISLQEITEHVEEALNKLPYRPQIIVEPGRRIVATSTSLVASIIRRIERPGGPWLFLDCGVYNALYEALAHQGKTRYPVSALRSSSGEPEAKFVLAGPTGDGLDVIARDVWLPADLQAEDQLLFGSVGAYTLALAASFNGFPPPPLRVREDWRFDDLSAPIIRET